MSTATDMLALYVAAESDILTNGSSSAFGDQALTMANLAEVRAGRREWEKRVAAESLSPGSPSLAHSLANLTTR